jgi:type IV pilus assembly protein PilE
MKRHLQGFSLIELMIAIAIVAILATVAYPSYQNYMLASHRTEAHTMLLSAANRQENYYLDFNQYASSAAALNLSDVSASGYYQLAISAATNSYTLTATASGAQSSDSHCQNMTINQNGVRGATNNDCWN